MKTKRFRIFSMQVEKDYVVSFHKDRKKNNRHTEAMTKIIDQSPISKDAYRKLATLQYELPCDYTILSTRKKINEELSQQIPILILNITDIPLIFIVTNKLSDINDSEIEEEMLKYISKAGY
ncbi:2942_t:CDS:2 [Scutellospora calospora]|uniref:2942_t:CDS:1 n=1 Tax=Scutellospora calospora TaxID=85575 RepID=A0ACA9MTG2_9GLOM|nr:2942_t:CDS:2 [Scutellospora calospora]